MRRTGPASPVLQIAIDAAVEQPLYRQLYDALRDSILSGRLRPGARLPSSRVLSADLGVARNTVLQAFEQLRSEGYIVGRRGGGSRVRSSIPDAMLQVKLNRRSRAGLPAAEAAEANSSPLSAASTVSQKRPLSKRGMLLADSGMMLACPGRSNPAAFELGVPALDAFPTRIWSRLAGRRLRRGNMVVADGDPGGEPALRAAIAEYVRTARDAQCTPDNVLIVNGAQQALHLLAQVLLDPGDAVWMENPGYTGARTAFEAAGARLIEVSVDAEGLDVQAGMMAAPNARAAYVTPSHQFPLGVLMSARRRLELLAWARQKGAWIIEDDYDSEFRYAGAPVPCLQGLDYKTLPSGVTPRVLYVGTFSKTLMPGLRLGYLIVPDELVDSLRAARAAMDRHSPTPYQTVLADFIGEGHYSRHVREVRNLCQERQSALIELAGPMLEGMLVLEPDPAGLHLVGWLPDGVDDERAAEFAAREGVRVAPLSRYLIGKPPIASPGALLLGYAAFDIPQIRAGLHRLGRALEKI